MRSSLKTILTNKLTENNKMNQFDIQIDGIQPKVN